MHITDNDYDAIISIDKRLLDEECLLQPKLFLKWSNELTHVNSKLKEAKKELKVIAAELAKKMRLNPDLYGLKNNPSEVSINSVMDLQKEYQEQLDMIAVREYDVDMLENVRQALLDRKKELENLVQLHGQQYFSAPKISTDDAHGILEERKRMARFKTHHKIEEQQ